MSEHQILNWKSQVTQELSNLSSVNDAIIEGFDMFFSEEVSEYDVKYTTLCNLIGDQTKIVDTILSSYNERFVHMASYYDKSCKSSTLVSENYEKLEECLEVIRSELKDVVKKLYSFTTLEMDYYDKIISSYPKKDSLLDDYNEYKARLNNVYKSHQVKLFCSNTCASLASIRHIMTKLYAVLDNKDNINEIKKLWEVQESCLY